ncbi:hypothetical protein [Fodinibius sp.]|uniref:hypothetical protein n=1 Tax=Fodinibius sp. TaxID=1872440 RepID=UPI002ACE8C97|nr:hypothetical protein [Fodinibius sp.]MDZ7659654.1 hypothetical protein [Fodinibius sp.]
MPNFDDFIDQLKNDLVDHAQQFGDDVMDEFVEDGKAFAEEAKGDLKRWTQLMAEGKLTSDDLKFLVKGKKDLAKMEALKQKGLAKARLDKFKDILVGTVVSLAITLFEGHS